MGSVLVTIEAHDGTFLNVTQAGKITFEKRVYSGSIWLMEHNKDKGYANGYNLKNMGNSSFQNKYLNITKEGKYSLVDDLDSGTYWNFSKLKKGYLVRNMGNSAFKHYYLNKKENGQISIESRQYRGCYIKKIRVSTTPGQGIPEIDWVDLLIKTRVLAPNEMTFDWIFNGGVIQITWEIDKARRKVGDWIQDVIDIF